MIIIGSWGIGTSSLAGNSSNLIDLESSCFRISGVSFNDWYRVYGSVALAISKQGFDVLVASHAVLRKWLGTHNTSGEKIVICYPSKDLKDKLLKEKEEKEKFAWKNAEFTYADSIQEMIDDADKYGFDKQMLSDEHELVLESNLQYLIRDKDQDAKNLKLLKKFNDLYDTLHSF